MEGKGKNGNGQSVCLSGEIGSHAKIESDRRLACDDLKNLAISVHSPLMALCTPAIVSNLACHCPDNATLELR